MSPTNPGRRQLRDQIARESARIMVEGGITDYQLAKRKALSRLGLRTSGQLPRNDEIEAAIEEYQRLFRGAQPDRLLVLRQAAIGVMRLLEDFDPCLVGPVLSGTADEHSDVALHVFSESLEQVGFFLRDNRIPYRLSERRLRTGLDDYRRFPSYRFVVDDAPVELVVFDRNGARQSPLSPVDGKPMTRARLGQVEGLARQSRQSGSLTQP